MFAFHIHPLHHSNVTTARKSRTPPRNKNRVCGCHSNRDKNHPRKHNPPSRFLTYLEGTFPPPRKPVLAGWEEMPSALVPAAVAVCPRQQKRMPPPPQRLSVPPPWSWACSSSHCAAACAHKEGGCRTHESRQCLAPTTWQWDRGMPPSFQKKSTPQQAQALREIACSRV